MQTVVLPDGKGDPEGLNAGLGADGQAGTAADAGVRDPVALLFQFSASEGKGALSMGFLDRSNHSPVPS